MFISLELLLPVGRSCYVTPMQDDNFHDFQGTIIGYRNGYILVKDQQDDVFQVEPCQVALI